MYLRTENLESARLCFANALALDPLCYDAFNALCSGNMMEETELTRLVSSLEGRVPFEWFPKFCRVKTGKALEEVEGPLSSCREALMAKASLLYTDLFAVNDAYGITSKLVAESPNVLDQGLYVHLACL